MNPNDNSPQPHLAVSMIQSPPHTFGGILRRLGPGLIIAGSIVGSGELIATTKTGAEAGFALLWLIIIGCVIKVFAQVEFGRYSINTGRTTMDGLNELPGPRLRVSWLVWYWFVMQLFSIAQLGGIVGAVGVSMAMSFPLSGDFNALIQQQKAWDVKAAPLRAGLIEEDIVGLSSKNWDTRKAALAGVHKRLEDQLGPRPSQDNFRASEDSSPGTKDDVYWAAIITVITAIMLVLGRYNLVQNVATFLVASFTFVTIINLLAIQRLPQFAIRWDELAYGLGFHLPPDQPGSLATPLATAMAAFGIIGVGAAELVAYPYWCLEKGYARFAGPRADGDAWAERARGWLRVMRWDAWCSMAIYTFATLAFYLLGAAVLHRQDMNPADDLLVPTLIEMYQPIFREWAAALFLFGAFAVLYSTFFVATAGNSRVSADAVRIFGLRADTDAARHLWTRIFCGLFPFVSLFMYIYLRNPGKLVLASGVIQAIMLPMLGAAALFFRYRRCDPRVRPGTVWDILLWISAFGLLLAGGWAALASLFPQLKLVG